MYLVFRVMECSEPVKRSHDVMEKAKSMLDWNGDAYSPSKVIEAVTIPKKTAVGVCVQGITIGSSEI